MRAILGCGLAVGLVILAGTTAAAKDEKIDAKKLIGKWEPKDDKKDAKMVLEFAKDGKLTLSVDAAGKTEKLAGSYKLAGNKLSVALKFGDQEIKEELTVLKLTDDEMQTEDSKGKKETMKKVKGAK
jgi:uncharacterized protein (TIGR03066 family)